MTDVETLLSRHGITGNVTPVGANPVERTAPGDVHYQATLRRGEHAIDLYCSTRAGQPAPALADVLLAAGGRAAAVERAGSLEAWAALGRDPHDADVARWYEAQRAEARGHRAFLGAIGFDELTRDVAEATGAPIGAAASGAQPQHDPVGYPARSDEMIFQEPALAAREQSAWVTRSRATAGAAVTAGAVTGVALGMAAGRTVRRLPAVGAMIAGLLFGIAGGALAATRLVHRESPGDALTDLADQRSAIDTGRK